MATLQNTNPIYMDWLIMSLIVTKQPYFGRNNADHSLYVSRSIVNRDPYTTSESYGLSYPGLWAEVVHIVLNKIDKYSISNILDKAQIYKNDSLNHSAYSSHRILLLKKLPC